MRFARDIHMLWMFSRGRTAKESAEEIGTTAATASTAFRGIRELIGGIVAHEHQKLEDGKRPDPPVQFDAIDIKHVFEFEESFGQRYLCFFHFKRKTHYRIHEKQNISALVHSYGEITKESDIICDFVDTSIEHYYRYDMVDKISHNHKLHGATCNEARSVLADIHKCWRIFFDSLAMYRGIVQSNFKLFLAEVEFKSNRSHAQCLNELLDHWANSRGHLRPRQLTSRVVNSVVT